MGKDKKEHGHTLNTDPGEYKLTGSDLRLAQRHNLTVQHLQAAILFYKNCYRIEQEHEGEKFGEFFTGIRSYVTASVILSAATLEAYVNEIFINVVEGRSKGINEKYRLEIENKWEDIKKKDTTLEKYKKYLKYVNKTRKNSNEYFYPSILVKIRNGLVHYVPKWDKDKTPEEEMESQLGHLKNIIKFSPFIDEKAPLFPMRCMTYDLARWSIETVLDFIKWFEDTANLENKFERFREHMKFDI